jgi:cytoskeletal protein CcmA (bactofilin family)
MFSKGSSSKRPSTEPQSSAVPESAPESKKPASASRGVPSILSKDLKIFGNLESEGELQIDGLVEGDVRGTSIVLGESGEISGNLNGELVRIAGKISGGVDASKVELDTSARVLGDIRHDLLSIASGAYVVGKVVRRDSKQPQSEPARPAATAPQAPTSPAAASSPPPSGARPDTASSSGAPVGGSVSTPGTTSGTTTPGGRPPAATPGKPV